jgi:hypothetical protein
MTVRDFIKVYKNPNVILSITNEDDEEIIKVYATGNIDENLSSELLSKEVKRVKQNDALHASIILKTADREVTEAESGSGTDSGD